MKMLNAFYIFLVGSGIGATFLPQGQVVYAYDDLKVRSTQVDGFPRIDVYSPHNKTKPAFSRYKDGQFLVSATIWKIPGSPDVGLRFIFVVGAGPSQQLVIAGPNRDGSHS